MRRDGRGGELELLAVAGDELEAHEVLGVDLDLRFGVELDPVDRLLVRRLLVVVEHTCEQRTPTAAEQRARMSQPRR